MAGSITRMELGAMATTITLPCSNRITALAGNGLRRGVGFENGRGLCISAAWTRSGAFRTRILLDQKRPSLVVSRRRAVIVAEDKGGDVFKGDLLTEFQVCTFR